MRINALTFVQDETGNFTTTFSLQTESEKASQTIPSKKELEKRCKVIQHAFENFMAPADAQQGETDALLTVLLNQKKAKLRFSLSPEHYERYSDLIKKATHLPRYAQYTHFYPTKISGKIIYALHIPSDHPVSSREIAHDLNGLIRECFPDILAQTQTPTTIFKCREDLVFTPYLNGETYPKLEIFFIDHLKTKYGATFFHHPGQLLRHFDRSITITDIVGLTQAHRIFRTFTEDEDGLAYSAAFPTDETDELKNKARGLVDEIAKARLGIQLSVNSSSKTLQLDPQAYAALQNYFIQLTQEKFNSLEIHSCLAFVRINRGGKPYIISTALYRKDLQYNGFMKKFDESGITVETISHEGRIFFLVSEDSYRKIQKEPWYRSDYQPNALQQAMADKQINTLLEAPTFLIRSLSPEQDATTKQFIKSEWNKLNSADDWKKLVLVRKLYHKHLEQHALIKPKPRFELFMLKLTDEVFERTGIQLKTNSYKTVQLDILKNYIENLFSILSTLGQPNHLIKMLYDTLKIHYNQTHFYQDTVRGNIYTINRTIELILTQRGVRCSISIEALTDTRLRTKAAEHLLQLLDSTFRTIQYVAAYADLDARVVAQASGNAAQAVPPQNSVHHSSPDLDAMTLLQMHPQGRAAFEQAQILSPNLVRVDLIHNHGSDCAIVGGKSGIVVNTGQIVALFGPNSIVVDRETALKRGYPVGSFADFDGHSTVNAGRVFVRTRSDAEVSAQDINHSPHKTECLVRQQVIRGEGGLIIGRAWVAKETFTVEPGQLAILRGSYGTDQKRLAEIHGIHPSPPLQKLFVPYNTVRGHITRWNNPALFKESEEFYYPRGRPRPIPTRRAPDTKPRPPIISLDPTTQSVLAVRQTIAQDRRRETFKRRRLLRIETFNKMRRLREHATVDPQIETDSTGENTVKALTQRERDRLAIFSVPITRQRPAKDQTVDSGDDDIAAKRAKIETPEEQALRKRNSFFRPGGPFEQREKRKRAPNPPEEDDSEHSAKIMRLH